MMLWMKMMYEFKRMLEMNVIVGIKMIPSIEMIWGDDDDDDDEA